MLNLVQVTWKQNAAPVTYDVRSGQELTGTVPVHGHYADRHPEPGITTGVVELLRARAAEGSSSPPAP